LYKRQALRDRVTVAGHQPIMATFTLAAAHLTRVTWLGGQSSVACPPS
jgi:hypothetical protein